MKTANKVDLKNQDKEAAKLQKPLADLFVLLKQRDKVYLRLKDKKAVLGKDPVLDLAYTVYQGLRAYFD